MSWQQSSVCLFCFLGGSLVAAASSTQQACATSSCIDMQTPDQAEHAALSLVQKKSQAVKPHSKAHVSPTAKLYLDTVRDTLTGAILRTPDVRPDVGDGAALTRIPFNEQVRWRGTNWCENCFTMAGGARVQNVRDLVERTITEDVPGDFLEAGTWRGGCSIMARVVQKVLDKEGERKTYVCDSFSGLPPTSQSGDEDYWSKMNFLEVSQEEVADDFKRFQALDENVQFRKGYFSATMPIVRKELKEKGRKLAVLRGDGDMYESFMDILYNLYDFVPVGGYFICDDCPMIGEAQKAIDEFRKHHGINSTISLVEGSSTGSFWRKEDATLVDYDFYLKWNATRHFKDKASE